jgi:spore maturation protein CgeB
MRIVVLGLSLSSSWGNGHATTWRALLRAMAGRGHEILFLERDQPWYAAHRDLTEPDFCELALYDQLADLDRFAARIRGADAVIVGSFVPEGAQAIRAIVPRTRGLLAFYDIDTPITMRKLDSDEHAYISPELVPLFDLYLSFTGGPTLRRLERQYGARMARALYCAVDTQTYRATGGKLRWALGYLGTYSEDRQPLVQRLLIDAARLRPGERFVVAGPQYPDSIEWPANVDRIEHLPPAQHAQFYSSLRWALNVTRADMVRSGWSPSVRIFEAAACGAPIISDAWDGIETFLRPGSEMLRARDTADVLAALDVPAARRDAIARAACARTRRCHTAEVRAGELEQHLLEAAGRRRLDMAAAD